MFFLLIVVSTQYLMVASSSMSKDLSVSSSGAIIYNIDDPPDVPPYDPPDNAVTVLHVDGRYIKNVDDEIIFLRGAAFGDLSDDLKDGIWQGGSVTARFYKYLELFGGQANVIRVPIGGFSLDNDMANYGNMKNSIFELLGLCIENELYFVLDFHGGVNRYYENILGIPNRLATLGQNPQPFYDWWTDVLNWVMPSGLYAGVPLYNIPNVICEAYNEPQGSQWGGDSVFIGIMEEWEKIVHALNPDLLLFISSPNFNHIDYYWVENRQPNVVYTWDWYLKDFNDAQGHLADDYTAGQSGMYARMDALMYPERMQYAVENDLPIISSEWGIATWHFSDGVIPEQAVIDYITVMNYYETGWWTWWWWAGQYGLVADWGYSALTYPYGTVMNDLIF